MAKSTSTTETDAKRRNDTLGLWIALGAGFGLALGALFVLHQSVVFARAALRASWFAKAHVSMSWTCTTKICRTPSSRCSVACSIGSTGSRRGSRTTRRL